MSRIRYFSRCRNHIVRLSAVTYAIRAPQLPGLSYAGQTNYIRDSRTQLVSTPSHPVAPGLHDYFAIGVCEACGLTHAADRLIDRGLAPSGHACDARCRYARGIKCECACGGAWHGVGDTQPGQTTLTFAAPAAELTQLIDDAGDAPTDLWRF